MVPQKVDSKAKQLEVRMAIARVLGSEKSKEIPTEGSKEMSSVPLTALVPQKDFL